MYFSVLILKLNTICFNCLVFLTILIHIKLVCFINVIELKGINSAIRKDAFD